MGIVLNKKILFYNDRNEEIGKKYQTQNQITSCNWNPTENELIIGNDLGEIETYNPMTGDSKKDEEDYVLKALGLSEKEMRGSIRISLGFDFDEVGVDRVVREINDIITTFESFKN